MLVINYLSFLPCIITAFSSAVVNARIRERDLYARDMYDAGFEHGLNARSAWVDADFEDDYVNAYGKPDLTKALSYQH